MSYYWDVPLSEAEPTEKDLLLNDTLRECLAKHQFFETEEESTKREIVLGSLDKLVKEWIYKVTLKKTKSEAIAGEAGGKIFTMGSYRLGVHQKGADIDTLILSPKHIDREDFFTDFYEMLLKSPEVSKLTRIRDAHTPIMSLIFSGIEIDLLFATIDRSSIPEDINISDTSILKTLDEKSIRSLNGPRVAEELLKLVPNVATYRRALCAIKLWAQCRGIYSNVMGFLGGIAWALMTARVCQLYPKACAATVVARFFRVYKDWRWPQPVTLKPIEEGTLGFRVWNPKTNIADLKHLMPVITPSYPSMNSTYNVSVSTFTAMKEEISKATEVTREIENGTKNWEDLFEKSDFFTNYKHFFEVNAKSKSPESQNTWKGFVESRLRILIQLLEKVPMIEAAVPFADSFDHECTTKENNSEEEKTFYCTSFFLGLKIAKVATGNANVVDLASATESFQQNLTSWESRTPEMEIEMNIVKRKDLPSYVLPTGQEKKRKRRKKGEDDKKKQKLENNQKDEPNGNEIVDESNLENQEINVGEQENNQLIIEDSIENVNGLDSTNSNQLFYEEEDSSMTIEEPEKPILESSPQVRQVEELDSIIPYKSDLPELKKQEMKLKLASTRPVV